MSDQIEYNLLRRNPEEGLIPFCQREGLTVIAYSPLAQGLLTGKYGPGKMPKGLFRRAFIHFRYGRIKKITNLVEVLEEISRKGVPVSQIALSWLLEIATL